MRSTNRNMDSTEPSAPTRGTFLVVDDEPDILDAIARLFRKEYQVLTAQTVEEARALIAEHNVQVVMTDQRMPCMSGIDFLVELRECYPHIVRVLFTGYSNISDVIDAINEGHVYRYISKPWKPVELRLFVAQAFEHYRAQQERADLLERLQQANEQLERQNALLSAANEELTMLDRVKSVFMEVVSHELNTPIAIVFGYTFLLRKELGDEISPVAAKALAGIDSSAVRLKHISNRIFQMLHDREGGEPTLDFEWVELPKFVASIHEQIDPFLKRRNQELQVSLDPGLERIRADEDKLNDLCLNLLMNAIKFSHDDQTIALKIAPSDDDEMISITVQDRGVGIPDDEVSQIFDVFFSTFNRGHHSSGQFEFNKRGIGLGLALAKRFAEMHGGYIRVDTSEGRGSRFSVFLPRYTEEAAAPSLASSTTPTHGPH